LDPGYFIIAILGCADGSTDCTRVATVPTHYSSEATCAAATGDALASRSDLDFPTLVAQCRAMKAPAAARTEEPRTMPAGAVRG
jgi:hypothetical protein